MLGETVKLLQLKFNIITHTSYWTMKNSSLCTEKFHKTNEIMAPRYGQCFKL